jgi:2-keto-4-pentenoate hydratase/2-oxohepta-3-ene-1,7-dioic acid hydratase in catechol pathway
VKLARFHRPGETRRDAGLGVVIDDGQSVIDLRQADPELPREVGELFGLAGWQERVEAASGGTRNAVDDVVLLAPVARPGKFLAVGRNYAEHAAELGGSTSEFPVIFTKQSTCVNDPGGVIEIPSVSEQVDYEGELGVVIGTRCRAVPVADALDVVGGYLCVNDVSVRDWQRRSPTMTLGKSFDTHGPIGPWVVTTDEIADPHRLELRTTVNGEVRQQASTGEMIHRVADVVTLVSTVCTLEPGDIISTGTPAGVGAASDPPKWLRDGDVVVVEISGIGALANPVRGPTA